jgi:hypothetical protein
MHFDRDAARLAEDRTIRIALAAIPAWAALDAA